MDCTGLDSSGAEIQLFQSSGEPGSTPALLERASGGILFLDAVDELVAPLQRKLARLLQARQRRPEHADVELVCTARLSPSGLRRRLDATLFDTLVRLVVTLPPLRDCREDLRADWAQVWSDLRVSEELPQEAPWTPSLEQALSTHPLPGNYRDLERLAVLVMASGSNSGEGGLTGALHEWALWASGELDSPLGEGSRDARIRWFRRRLAHWAKERHGTWAKAAKALACDEKTLRTDARQSLPSVLLEEPVKLASIDSQ